MSQPHWRRVPWVLLSCLCSCLLWPVILGSTSGNTEDTSSPQEPRSFTSVTKGVSTIAVSSELSRIPSSSTSTQESSSLSQNTQTQPITISQSQMSTRIEDTTSNHSSPSGQMLTETVSPGTSPEVEITTLSPSSVSNTPSTTSEVITPTISTDSALGNTGDTSPPQVSGNFTPVTTGVSRTPVLNGQSTGPSPVTSTQESTAFSHTTQTQIMGTTSVPQMSTLVEVTTLSHSSTSLHTLKETVSPGTSPEITISSPLSISKTPSTASEVITPTISTDSTLGNTGDKSPPHVSGSFTPVTTGVLRTPVLSGQPTGPSPITSTQQSVSFSQDLQDQSLETTTLPQMTTLPETITSSLSSSTNGHTLTETLWQETSTTDTITTSSPSSITNTPSATPELFTVTTPTDSTLGNTEDTSSPYAPKSLILVPTGVSTTLVSNELSTVPSSSTFAQEPTAFSQTTQTQIMETTSQPQLSTLVEVTTLTHSSTGRNTLKETVSPGISPEITTSNPLSVGNTPSPSSEVFTPTISTDSALGNTGVTSPPQVSGSFTPVTTGVSRTPVLSGQSTGPRPITSTQESVSLSQNMQDQSLETTTLPQMTTLTETITSSLPSSTNGHTMTETLLQETSTIESITTLSPSSVTSTLSATPELFTVTTSTGSTPGNLEDTSSPYAPGSLISVTKGVTTPVSSGLLTGQTIVTSTQESTAFSQTTQTQIMETTSQSQMSTFLGATTSPYSFSRGMSALTETVSPGTSPVDEITTSSPSSESNTPSTISEVITPTISIDSTRGNTGDTSPPQVSGSFMPVTTGDSRTPVLNGLSTGQSPITSTQESTAFSHTTQTQIMGTTSVPQMSTLVEVTTLSHSSTSLHTLKETVSPGTSPEITTSSPLSISKTPSTASEVITPTISTDSTLGNTGDKSPPHVSGSFTPVTTGVLRTPVLSGQPTGPSPITSTQQSVSLSQNMQDQSLETTTLPQMTTLPETITSSLSSSTNGHTLTETLLQETSTTDTITTSSPSSITNTPSATPELFTVTTPTDSTLGNTDDTSSPYAPKSLILVPTGVSTTPVSNELSTVPSSSTFAQEPTAFSQTTQTQIMETTSQPQLSTLVEVTTLTHSSTGRNTLKETVSPGISPEITTSNPLSVGNTPSPSSEVFTPTISTDSALGNTGDTSPPQVSGSFTPVTTGVLRTPVLSGQSTGPGPITSTQESVSLSQNMRDQSLETTTLPQMTTLTETITSSLSSSTNGHTMTETMLQEISATSNITTPSPSATSEVFTMTISTESILGNMEDTSPPQVSESFSPDSVGVSSGPSTRLTLSTSTQESPAFSQTTQTPSMEATSQSQISTLTKATASAASSSPRGPTLTVAALQGTAFPGVVASSLRPHSTSPPSTSPPPLSTSTSSASTGSRSTAPPSRGIPLFPYGSSAGDLQLFVRGVDITSRLLKLQIGFPFGSSLRDSLYFTDNGQIIFPESDYHIFSYSNPPSRGFTRWDTVAMVAPFWDDADFSTHRGIIFYQEYETLYGEYDSLVRQVETWVRQLTNSWDYNAKWTIKITWVTVPAYPAQWTFGTNTYQAILTTDGSRSYALFLYQRGGMQWDVTHRQRSSVVMGFTSGDGYFENSPLMSQPVWKKYRPDQFLDPRSGFQGLQVYRLHREERPNFRLKCLQWLKSQPQWPSWGWSHISCPCSWQQGQWDLRYQPVRTGWWDPNSRKLCSFSSLQGGVCCSYGPWGEFREGWSVQSRWHFDQELESQNWCCRWNDRPFLCDLYRQRRPRISCVWYRPPRPAWTLGDPHFVTFDDVNYTFNGLGDFLLTRAWNGNSSFLLQGRTAQTSSAKATNFIAFAAQYNSSTVGPITVQWLLDVNNTINVLHNHHHVSFEANHVDAEGLQIFNATGLLLTRNDSQVSASFDGTVTITVVALSNILHVSSSLPEEYQNHTEGLLGVWNNNPEDDFRMPNGSTIPRNSSEEMLYHYGMTWQINGTGLLGKRNDSLPSNFTPEFLFQLTKRNNMSLVSECNGNIPCTYDILATGNRDTGRQTMMVFEKYQWMNTSLNQNPPLIYGPEVIIAYKGKTKEIHFFGSSENITFTLRDNCSDFTLFENGNFLWKPTSLRPCSVEILARDKRTGLSSVLQPKAVVCFCNAERQCLFNQTKWVNSSSLEEASCQCDGDRFGQYCERKKDPCDQECFPNVSCIRGKGCEACPPNMTGDGRHCAALEELYHCANHSCPVNFCYNQGHCYISRPPDCQPTCTCLPAFTDTRCLLAGNNFTPAIYGDLPLRVIRLMLKEEENASVADVNASVAYRLETLDVRAFLRNSQVQPLSHSTLAPGRIVQQWLVISEFQYRPRGPIIHFLNNQLREAIVEVFLQAPRGRQKRSVEPKNNVVFYPISEGDVRDEKAVNLSTLETYFKCDGYKGYRLAYDPQSGFTCVSPCSGNYCHHGGQCHHLPDGPRCSCSSFSIYTPWGERCERLSVKLGAFLGILLGALGALLLLGVGASVGLRLWGRFPVRNSYLLPES